MSYHREIMNIRRADVGPDTYACGHKDARHAAAEIAVKAEAEIEQLREALSGAVLLLECIMPDAIENLSWASEATEFIERHKPHQ